MNELSLINELMSIINELMSLINELMSLINEQIIFVFSLKTGQNYRPLAHRSLLILNMPESPKEI